jgi:hypothetical protein
VGTFSVDRNSAGWTSMHSTAHRSRGYFWEEEDIERLKVMFDSHVDPVDILRAFPDYRWKALTERMRYHFGKGWWKSYQARSTWQKPSRKTRKRKELSK